MITPADGPSSPENYAKVTPYGNGPAAYDIVAPMGEGEISSAFDRANADGGAGALYPQGARQAQAEKLIQSPAGFGLGGFDVNAGTTAGWPNDVEP